MYRFFSWANNPANSEINTKNTYSSITPFFFIINNYQIRIQINSDLVDFVPVSTVDVEAVVGRTAVLPCDIEPDSHEDRVYMVLWFRHAGGKPLYR